MTIGRRDVKLFGEKRRGVPLVILNTVHDEGEEVWEAVRTLTDAVFTLAAVGRLDWNNDMTPWPAPPAARWDSPYGGSADGYLIYGRRAGGAYEYIGMTRQGTTFTDTKASSTEYNYYWVFPFQEDADGNIVAGTGSDYTYGRAK